MQFSIRPVGHELDAALQHKIDNKTKPLGSLGLLERIALKVGRIQNTLSPVFTHPHMLIFAGDHGAATAGISAYPQDVSWQMVENYLRGGAGANVFSRLYGMAMVVIDAGIAHDFGRRDGLIDAKISPRGTRNYLVEAAMTRAQCETALARGAGFAREAIARGCNVMGLGEKGIGNTGSASLITHLLTETPLAECVGRGTGLDDAGLAHKRALMQQAIDRAQLPPDADVMTVLTEFGGFEIVMMVGAYLAAAEAGVTLLGDGVIATSALLAARAHRTARARLRDLLPQIRRGGPRRAAACARRRPAARPRHAPRRRHRCDGGLSDPVRRAGLHERDGQLRIGGREQERPLAEAQRPG